MKHIQIFEDFQTGPMKKPAGLFSRLAKSAKHSMGFESEADRKSLATIYRYIRDDYQYDWVGNIREIQPGVVIAWINSNPVTVNRNEQEILYQGKELDLHNIEEEVESLFNALLKLKSSKESF
jgi:transcriptional regulator with AAA-type ATPase domain